MKFQIFQKVTFYVKEELDEIISKESMYEIDYIFRYNSENEIDNSEYIKELKSKNLNPNFLKETLIFMISRGTTEASILKKEFDIDSSDIGIDVFLEGFTNSMKGLLDSDLSIDYIKLYKNEQELLEAIGKRGKIMLLSDLIFNNGLEIKKLDDDKIDIVLSEFKKKLNKNRFLEKINIIGFYDWFSICYELFENHELAYSKIQKIFKFTKREKRKFEEFKESHLFMSYQDEIQEYIDSFEDINFQEIAKFTYNDSLEQKIDFHKKITELMIGLSFKSSYSVVFLDISGRKEEFNIGNGVKLDGYSYSLLEKESYEAILSERYRDFKLNLSKNNMDFSILIFKQNGDKDDIPDEYEEELRVAA